MNSFSISQMQQYSGISVHSIRAWEKRYNALKPGRSEGNTRYYSGNQLRRLLNIVSLSQSEYKIAELCAMTDTKLHELLGSYLEKETINDTNNEFLVSQIVSAALLFDELLFEKIFSRSIVSYGIEGTYTKVIYPALLRIGLMWTSDRVAPAQEHFISNLLRQKLSTSIDMLPLNNNPDKHWILFLPENEFHETGLLMANYLIRNAGHRCTYLGSNVPMDSLKQAVQVLKPTSLLFFLVSKGEEKGDKDLVKQMLKNFPSQNIFVASDPDRLRKIKDQKNYTPLNSLTELKELLKGMSKL